MTPEEGITFNTHRVEVNFTLVALPKERGETNAHFLEMLLLLLGGVLMDKLPIGRMHC